MGLMKKRIDPDSMPVLHDIPFCTRITVTEFKIRRADYEETAPACEPEF